MRRLWWPSCVAAIRNGVFLPRRVRSRSRRGRSWWPRPHRLELWGLKRHDGCVNCLRWSRNSRSIGLIRGQWCISPSILRRRSSESPRLSAPGGPKPSTGWRPKSGPAAGMGDWPNFDARPMGWPVCSPLRLIGFRAVACLPPLLDTPASAGPSKLHRRRACPRPGTASRFFLVLDPKKYATTCR